VRAATLRKRIAATGTALVLAVTFGVMGATGIALARGDGTTATTPAETEMLTVPVPTTQTFTQPVTVPSKSKSDSL
jgi:hypothetical protein